MSGSVKATDSKNTLYAIAAKDWDLLLGTLREKKLFINKNSYNKELFIHINILRGIEPGLKALEAVS